MLVLITGSRNWSDPAPIEAALTHLKRHHEDLKVIHGAARGADSVAGSLCKQLGIECDSFPANWKTAGPRAGLDRNTQMLHASPDLVLAFKALLDPGLSRGGTEHMVKISLEADVNCWWHDGSGWRRPTMEGSGSENFNSSNGRFLRDTK